MKCIPSLIKTAPRTKERTNGQRKKEQVWDWTGEGKQKKRSRRMIYKNLFLCPPPSLHLMQGTRKDLGKEGKGRVFPRNKRAEARPEKLMFNQALRFVCSEKISYCYSESLQAKNKAYDLIWISGYISERRRTDEIPSTKSIMVPITRSIFVPKLSW